MVWQQIVSRRTSRRPILSAQGGVDAPRNRCVPRFARVSVAHANSSSLVRAHSFPAGRTAIEQGWYRCCRRRDRVGIASREAPYWLSIIIDLGRELLGLLSPVHSYEISLPSLTTSLIINCISARLNRNGTFQCRSINESANPRSRSSDESGRGRAAAHRHQPTRLNKCHGRYELMNFCELCAALRDVLRNSNVELVR